MTIIEIAIVPLKGGHDVESDQGKKVFQDKILSVIKAQPGCQEIYWGRQVEHNETVQMLIGDAPHSHRKPTLTMLQSGMCTNLTLPS